ncbi:MAG: hypothetical protein IT384_26100 [Deltaproteobacteria bacterium]|nr:hypothetical protein [Deltaproteobacteria bacterium]
MSDSGAPANDAEPGLGDALAPRDATDVDTGALGQDATSADAPPTGDGSSPDTGQSGGSDAGPRDARPLPDGGPFDLNPRLAGLGDETALDLGRMECTPVGGEDPDLCRRTTDYSGMVYDPHRHQVLAFGGGHSTTMTDAIHALDLAGNLTWSELYLPTPCSAMSAGNLDATNGAWLSGAGGPFPRPVSTHTYDGLAIAPNLDEFLVISRTFTGGYCNPVGNDIGGNIAHFDRALGTWSFSPTASGSTYEFSVSIPASEPDPVSGQIVFLSRGGLALYDPATRVYTWVSDTIVAAGYADHMVYFPPNDRFYYFSRGTPVEVYALSLNRSDPTRSTVERLVTTGPSSPHGEPAYAYDSWNQVIGGGVQDSTFYTFDPMTRAWAAHPMTGGTPGSLAFHNLVYDPVNNVFIFVTDYDSGQRTWAYRLRQ